MVISTNFVFNILCSHQIDSKELLDPLYTWSWTLACLGLIDQSFAYKPLLKAQQSHLCLLNLNRDLFSFQS